MFSYLIVWLHVVSPAGNATNGVIVGMLPAQTCAAAAMHASIKTGVVRTGCTTGEDADAALDAFGCTRLDRIEIDGLPAVVYHCKELPTWN